MRRLLRIRLLFVLVALLLVPTLTLPFAERLRTEWARYWEPEPTPPNAESLEERLAAVERAFQSAMRSRRGPIVIPSSFSSLDRVEQSDHPSPTFGVAGSRIGQPTSAERAEKQERFLRAMYRVELSDVPFPDEPPLSYPDAARWADLIAESEARKNRSTTAGADR